jgi:cobyrinic acid a,c-diamide synthase
LPSTVHKRPKGLVVAAAHSGAGKTTLTLALMAAFRRRGLVVQPFKVGPDFIDPGHHFQAAGRRSHNLDGWMMSEPENRAVFGRWSAGADLVVVEGVMGLYDGRDGRAEAGSTAQMAKWLNLLLLCVDARSMARSLAAVALGFVRFDPEVTWAGLAANRVGSPRHTSYLAEAMESVPEIQLLGGLARDELLTVPERHLGLVTAEDHPLDRAALDRLADWVEAGLDLDRLLAILPDARATAPEAAEPPPGPPVRIGVPRDQAFCFYYEENLRRLAAAGAEPVFFSPLAGDRLPPDLSGLYIGGGYPELFARRLAEHRDLMDDVRRLAENDRPIYGECGGLMYLSQSLTDLDGRTWPMTGLLPLKVRMIDRLRSLGYREATLTRDSLWGRAGDVCRGHEFHYSNLETDGGADNVYAVRDRFGRSDAGGYQHRRTLASYLHLHFGSNPDAARCIADACRRGTR